MATMLGNAVESLVRDEVSRWVSHTLKREADIQIVDDLADIDEIISDRDRDDVTVVAWTEFDEMDCPQFYQFIEDLNTAHGGLWIEGQHPDGERADLFDTYEGHVADDYALIFIHNVLTIGD